MPNVSDRNGYRARRAVQIALQVRNKWPLYVPGAEATRLLAPDQIGISTFRQARKFVSLANPELINRVLGSEISLYRGVEIVTKGERVTCPACEGRGHIYKKNDSKNR